MATSKIIVHSPRKIEYNDVFYKSCAEVDVRKQLDDKPCISTYEPISFEYFVEGWYTPDFKVCVAPGKEFYIEVKGKLDRATRIIYQAMRKTHPDLDLRFLFLVNNKINKGAKMRYTDWATKYHFPCAVGQLPAEWFV
jgi:hypothetical protein